MINLGYSLNPNIGNNAVAIVTVTPVKSGIEDNLGSPSGESPFNK